MINSSFIQGFKLDDYYPAAPLHSNSVIIPAVLPLMQRHREIDGRGLLGAVARGYEVGTRMGLALYRPQMQSRGWRSCAVFGGPPAAASAGALLKFSAAQHEDALGIATTQSCGPMSAPYAAMGALHAGIDDAFAVRRQRVPCARRTSPPSSWRWGTRRISAAGSPPW